MRYPLGSQDFRTLRTDGAVYVDKTEHIARVLNSGRYFFLSRPRRFGKSLTLSTMNELYSGSSELFEGLWAEKHWRFAERQRPVVWLKFASSGYQQGGLRAALLRMITEQAELHGIEEADSDNVGVRFKGLLSAVAKTHPSGRVALLVDEYDKPIIDYIDDIAKAEAQRDELKVFYSVLKDAEPHIEVVFITGVSAFSKVSLFSDLNNLTNLTMDPLADTLVGITQVELENAFGARLNELEYTREQVRTWYNGYSWGGKERVYNPWSLLTFLKTGVLENYWVETGIPALLTKLMKRDGLFDVAGSRTTKAELTSLDLAKLTPIQLSFQTGYLTINRAGPIPGTYVLNYPNKEVETSFLRALLADYSYSDSVAPTDRLVRLIEAFQVGDVASVIQVINTNFAGIPYQEWQGQTETFYHAIVHTMFTMLGTYFHSEVSVAGGRADAIVEMEEYVYAFEFKLDRPVAEALRQIEERGYLASYADSGKQLIAVGISFSSADKKVGDWAQAAASALPRDAA